MTDSMVQALRGFALAGLVFTSSAAACSEQAQSEKVDTPNASGVADNAATSRVPVDPCALLTAKEISDLLLLTLSPEEVARLTPKEFVVTPTEVPGGDSRQCEFAYETKDRRPGGPVLRGNFDMTISPIAFAAIVPEGERRRLDGAGPEMFFHHRSDRTYFVTKGKYVASVMNFRGSYDPTGKSEDGARVALLKRIAERLP